MFCNALLTILLGFCLSAVQTPGPAPQKMAPAKQYFIAVFSRGPAWDRRKPANEQTGFKEHSENLRRLRAERKLAIGGRYGEKGMVIVEARDEEEARAQFVSDGMVAKETFTLELFQFRPFYKGSIE